jgi:SAM-dependent methyltransferase
MKTTEAILETNKKQKEFYNNIKQNFLTKLWANFRNGVLNKIRKSLGIQDQAYQLHKLWFGDLSDKKVLDLGCFTGNYWSFYLAENSKEYIGIDLSDVAIDKFKQRLGEIPSARAEAVDFLSCDFKENNFDLIYAYGVLHHFENSTILIDRLNSKLNEDGIIISYDPLSTSWVSRFIRMVYRPFQTDADWEWPFSKKTFYKYKDTFDIIERRGVLGKAKWVVLLDILPISKDKKNRIGQNWHNHDWNKSKSSDSVLFTCMHITMLMKKK